MLAPIDVTQIHIETPRLILRPWRAEDLDAFFAYASEPGVGEMAGWKHHETLAESRRILDMFISHKKTLALVLKENGRVIGSLGLEEPHPDPVTDDRQGRELGYVLSKAYWGQGIMTEAVRTVIDYCFRVLELDYLTCSHFAWNDRSRRVIEKCGFSYIGQSLYETQLGTREPSCNYIIYDPNGR